MLGVETLGTNEGRENMLEKKTVRIIRVETRRRMRGPTEAEAGKEERSLGELVFRVGDARTPARTLRVRRSEHDGRRESVRARKCSK